MVVSMAPKIVMPQYIYDVLQHFEINLVNVVY